MKRITRDPGNLHYAFSAQRRPVARVSAEERTVFETVDASGGQIPALEGGTLDPSRFLPATGPVYVDHARPGDAIAIVIEDIRLAPQGHMWVRPGLGFAGRFEKMRAVAVTIPPSPADTCLFAGRIPLPLRPMVGTAGVAPAPGQEVSTRYPGAHGGNLDITQLGTGTRLWLQVQVDGALASLGDVHATMGDGEVCGTGVEIQAEVTVRFVLRPRVRLPMPVLETAEAFYFLGDAPLLEDSPVGPLGWACELLAASLALSAEEAHMLISAACDVKICQLVNGRMGTALRVPRSLLTLPMDRW